uniref:Putative secreted peptide n=1 Tax=Anopheles braziliensis TaxID=58242 RepID=A0A2M3ZRF2_9DIPT
MWLGSAPGLTCFGCSAITLGSMVKLGSSSNAITNHFQYAPFPKRSDLCTEIFRRRSPCYPRVCSKPPRHDSHARRGAAHPEVDAREVEAVQLLNQEGSPGELSNSKP